MDKKERDSVRNDHNLRVVVEDYGYSWDKIIAIIDRADKCDELEAKCKKYENALKFYSDGLHYRIENSDMILENGEVAAEALGIKRDNPPRDQVVEGINLTDGVEFNNDFRALEAKCDELEKAVEWLLPMAHNLLCMHKDLPKGLAPMFYHTLSYEGDLELRNRYLSIKELVERARDVK